MDQGTIDWGWANNNVQVLQIYEYKKMIKFISERLPYKTIQIKK